MTSPDIIYYNGNMTTLDPTKPTASAVAIKDDRFIAVGNDQDIRELTGENTKSINLNGRSVLPGLFDNHTHVIRGGLNYNMELRWDGVRSLADAMSMLKAQVDKNRHRSGYVSLADLLKTNLPKNVCLRSMRLTPSHLIHRFLSYIYMTAPY